MVDFSKVRAIDTHTHAEEPCGCHADDGYDDLQSTMAKYFGAPWEHPPTIPETAAHYREMNIAAVIFPVDAERETGFRRYNNYEVAEACAKESDILIPFASIDPHKGKLGAREALDLVKNHGVQGFKFHPTMQGFYPNDRMAYDLYEAIAETGKPACFTPVRPVSARACAAATACGSNIRTRCTSTIWPSTSPTCRSSSPIPRFPGRKRRCRSPPQAQRLYRPFRLVAEILSADPHPLRQFASEEEDAVRLGLADDRAGEMAGRLRQGRFQGRSAAVDPEGKRDAAAGRILRAFGVAHRIIAIRCGRSPVILQHMAKR
jgi:hypothetical protein